MRKNAKYDRGTAGMLKVPGWTRRKKFSVAKIAMVVSPLDTERIQPATTLKGINFSEAMGKTRRSGR